MGFKIYRGRSRSVRQGIRTILRSRPQWDVCGEAVNARTQSKKPNSRSDVIIMDITCRR